MSKKKSTSFTDTDIVIRETVVEPPVDTVSEPESSFEHIFGTALGTKSANVELENAEPKPVVNNYVIETVSVPKRSGRKATTSFPIADLEAGSEQSFLVPSTDVKKTTTKIRTFAYRNGFKVILRTEGDGTVQGIRVWRKK